MGVRYSPHMTLAIRDYTLAGYTSNSEIAAILARRFNPDITAADVAKWRREHAHFGNVVAGALQDTDAIAVSHVRKAIEDGSMADVWAWLKLRNREFTPKAKLEHEGLESLDERLARRAAANAPALYDPEAENGNDDYEDD